MQDDNVYTADDIEQDSAQSYEEYQAELEAEQKGMTKEQIMELMSERSEHAIDLDDLQGVPVNHNWVDRGEFLSCEHGGHTSHRHAKR